MQILQHYCEQFFYLHGRVLIKDVHSAFAAGWIDHHFAPRIVVICRHPLAVADSWFRVFRGDDRQFYNHILGQADLIEDYLQPYRQHISACSNDFWSRIGVYWASSYYVLLHQQYRTSDWKIVRHEDFCENPLGQFCNLCADLDLEWTNEMQSRLERSNVCSSPNPYVPKRLLDEEVGKWKKNLTTDQIEAVLKAVSPFQLNIYPNL